MIGFGALTTEPLNFSVDPTQQFGLIAEQGSFSVSGGNVTSNVTEDLAGGAAYSLTGFAIGQSLVASLQPGLFDLNGQVTGIGRSQVLTEGQFVLNGEEALLKNQFGLDAGSFALNGQDVNFPVNFPLDQENIVVQNQEAFFRINAPLDQGSFALSLNDALQSQSALLEGGSFALSAQDISLGSTFILDVDNMAFSLNGQITPLRLELDLTYPKAFGYDLQYETTILNKVNYVEIAHTVGVENTSYALSGQDVSLDTNVGISAQTGSFALTGQEGDFSFPATIEAGSFTFNGQDIGLKRGVALDSGSFVLTGQNTVSQFSRTLVREDYVILGSDLGPVLGFAVDDGAFALNGQDVDFGLGVSIFADPGLFNLTGETIPVDSFLDVESGNFVLNGQDGEFGKSFTVQLDNGTYNTVFRAGEDVADFVLDLDKTDYTIAYPPVVLEFKPNLLAERGSFTLNGQEIAAGIPQIMLSGPGTFILTEQDADELRLNIQPKLQFDDFELNGQDVEFEADLRIVADDTIFNLNGEPLQVERGYKIIAQNGTLSLVGQSIGVAKSLSLDADADHLNIVGFKLTRVRDDELTVFSVNGFETPLLRGKAPRFNFNSTGNDIYSPLPYDDAILPPFYIKSGDVSPGIRTILYDSEDQEINLLNARVRFKMRELGTKVTFVDQPATIISSPNGTVQYNWQPGETSTPGLYQAEFEVTYPDGSVETFPNDGYMDVEIRGKIA